MKINKTLLGSILILMIFTSAHAHQDRIIVLENNNLVGLPAEYQPAQLDLKASKLRIKNHEMDFSPYVKSFFEEEPYEIQISSSWYHTRSSLPPYLQIRIIPEDKDYRYQLLFNMNTLEIIDIEVVILRERTSRGFPVALSELQTKSIKESIKEVKDK